MCRKRKKDKEEGAAEAERAAEEDRVAECVELAQQERVGVEVRGEEQAGHLGRDRTPHSVGVDPN